jgi:hypothetical protein
MKGFVCANRRNQREAASQPPASTVCTSCQRKCLHQSPSSRICLPSALRLTLKVKVEKHSAESSERLRSCWLLHAVHHATAAELAAVIPRPTLEVSRVDNCIAVCQSLRERMDRSISSTVLLIVLYPLCAIEREGGAEPRWLLGSVKGRGCRKSHARCGETSQQIEPVLSVGRGPGAGACE